MKKYIFWVLFSIVCAAITAQTTPQNTEGVKKTVKKTRTKKAKKPYVKEIETADDIRLLAPKTVIDEPDTPVARINLITGEILIFRGNNIVARFDWACDNCFRVDAMELDTTTSDKFFYKKNRVTAQFYWYEAFLKAWRDYQKLPVNQDPDIIQLKKEEADIKRRIELKEAERAKKKTN